MRRDILEAAARAFARRGFHGTTMQDVAEEAEVAVGTLYNYFRGKEELYHSLVLMLRDDFASIHDEPMLPSLGFRDRLEWLLRRYFELVERNKEFFVMFTAERAQFDWELGSEVGDVARQSYLNWVQRMTEFLNNGIRDKALRKGDAKDMAYFVVGIINATVFRWLGGDLPDGFQPYVPRLMELLMDGLARRDPKR